MELPARGCRIMDPEAAKSSMNVVMENGLPTRVNVLIFLSPPQLNVANVMAVQVSHHAKSDLTM